MDNNISTKLYKLNFKELIDNATNRVYWEKKWEIFKYDGLYVEFLLDRIDITNNKLIGEIYLRGMTNITYAIREYITIPLQPENFNKLALEKELVGKVNNLFLSYGIIELKKSFEYDNLLELENNLESKLEDIASEFLDDHNVYNKDIREVYIDNYVCNNRKDLTPDWLDNNKGSKFVPHRVTFAHIMGCKDKAEYIIRESNVDCESLLEEADELRLLLEEGDFEEYKDNLESI